MKYNYEALTDQTFQQFVQALLLTVHPETICLPVRQPDGGRDALLYYHGVKRSHFVVFQVKFSSDPSQKTERDAIESLIKTEKEKVEALIEKGATHYYFITNVNGTAHLDSGSIDKLNKALADSFDIPSFAWWRADLDARLDNASDIKWSYPEICRATDVLQFLATRHGQTADREASRAITAYIGKQCGDDRDVKFKQVELKRQITDLFVDIPIGHKVSRRDRRDTSSKLSPFPEIDEYLDQLYDYHNYEDADEESYPYNGAANFLLHMPYGTGVSKFVVEGAPGQGKSTVTQFICQINRIRLLPAHRSDLSAVDDVFSSAPTRTPFRIDLRDFAAWVAGRHPYAKEEQNTLRAAGHNRSLESFLTMQINWNSGGLLLKEHHLVEFFIHSHSVLVLDGFDEVADITNRECVVKEICDAANRLATHALSLQIIVTSRPAAFANSPGFPADEWVHLELNDLKPKNIILYQKKWAEAQELNADERMSLASTLEEKLRLPHLRDLSRNPMQLTILLQLMHMLGAALPDKRTALYEKYMDIFLNREVEKKQIAGNHRELILSIHGLLAWVLQLQAEMGQGSGSITMEGLRSEVSDYLEREEHDPKLINILLTGTVERVGALVSRVQGTFEFEVQPLREYFAARHLHKTAPYSPPGNPRRGTRPDRFSALARNSYWTNVTRFFCGFYDVGELPSLVDELVSLGEEGDYSLITQPRRLAVMLLGDYVFAQSPKSMRRLIDFVCADLGFERLIAADSLRGQTDIRLPEEAGRELLFDTCGHRAQLEPAGVYRQRLREVMARNGSLCSVKKYFFKCLSSRKEREGALEIAQDLDLVEHFSSKEIDEFKGMDVPEKLRWLAEAGRFGDIAMNSILQGKACNAFFNFEMGFVHSRYVRNNHRSCLVVLADLLDPYALAELVSTQDEDRVPFRLRSYMRRRAVGGELSTTATTEPKELVDFTRLVATMSDTGWETWRNDLEPWSVIVDGGYQLSPSGRLFSSIAVVSVAVEKKGGGPDGQKRSGKGVDSVENEVSSNDGRSSLIDRWSPRGFEPTAGLVLRLQYGREMRTDVAWWEAQLNLARGDARIILLAVLMSWGSCEVLQATFRQIRDCLNELNDVDWIWLWNLHTLAVHAAGQQMEVLEEEWFTDMEDAEGRFLVAMTKRLKRGLNRRRLGRKCFHGYKGGDGRVLQVAAEWEVFSEGEDMVDWHYINRLSKLARSNQVRVLFWHSGVQRQIKVPNDIASDVLKDCRFHHSQWVALCEAALAADVAQRAQRVSTVAKDESWFDGEDSV